MAATTINLGQIQLNQPVLAPNQSLPLDSEVVKLTGDQTISGNKTFSSSPLIPKANDSDDSTKAATTSWVRSRITAWWDSLKGAAVTFGSTVTATGGFIGNLMGNSSTATKLATARTLNVQDADSTNTGTAASFDGSGNATIKLPSTIKASITGHASQDALDSEVVKLTGIQTISGNKTFTNTIQSGSSVRGVGFASSSLPSNSVVNNFFTSLDPHGSDNIAGTATATHDGWVILGLSSTGSGGLLGIESQSFYSRIHCEPNAYFYCVYIPVRKNASVSCYLPIGCTISANRLIIAQAEA